MGALVLSPFNEKAKHWLTGRKDVFAQLRTFVGEGEKKRIIWCHCASLGEFEQVRPLLEAIRVKYPQFFILLSFFSPSGYEIRKNYKGADHICYLPADSAENADKWLKLVRPELVLWVKYEYWHFYLQGIKKENIPLLLISGIFRKDQPFFKRWGGFHRNMLHCFTHLFVQNNQSKSLLSTVGLSANVSVSGDTRFDRVIELADATEAYPLIEKFIEQYPVIVAGSTWEEDEEELDHFANTHPEIKFIIAPHEIDEQHLKDIEKLFQRSIRFSALNAGVISMEATPFNPANMSIVPNVLIIDNIGMLAQLYRYARIAYVGGGFGNDGVHNVLEAAVYSKPVVFGPVYEKFAEAVDLIASDGAFCIENALELEAVLQLLLNDAVACKTAGSAAGGYVRANTGATAKIMEYIQENRLLTN